MTETADHEPSAEQLRLKMVEEQIHRRGICSPLVLDAMLSVPRERFVPESLREIAYADHALPVGHDQTISQPYIVAYMTELLSVTPRSRVLEIGTGTGYQTAILALLAQHVYSVERIAALQEQAARTLAELLFANVTFRVGDGSLGLPEFKPYDRILVTAAAPRVPGPLVDQLADGGTLVLPVGGAVEQNVVRVVREGSRILETGMLGCRFVRLIGQAAWEPDKTA